MMVYLDTSFVAPLVMAEGTSDAIEALVVKLKPGELTTSMWTGVEFASLVARKVRMGELEATQADAVRYEFARMLRDSFEIILPIAADFATASAYLATPRIGLRAGDALHLAIAANHGARKVLTLDRAFIEAGRALKLPVSRGIRT